MVVKSGLPKQTDKTAGQFVHEIFLVSDIVSLSFLKLRLMLGLVSKLVLREKNVLELHLEGDGKQILEKKV